MDLKHTPFRFHHHLPFADGKTLTAKAEMASSFAALGEGHWSEWRFGDHVGVIYATDTYCVFFNADGVAFTGSFSMFADATYKKRFMQVVTWMHIRSMDLSPLFHLMDDLRCIDGVYKLDLSILDHFLLDLHNQTLEV